MLHCISFCFVGAEMAILNKSISGDTQSVEEAIGDYAKVCLSSVFVYFFAE